MTRKSVRARCGRGALAFALVLGIGLAFEGRAQDQPESAEPAEIDRIGPEREAPSTVDEITVTGTRNSVTEVQAESQAITAFSMEELDRSNIVNVEQLAFNVPALLRIRAQPVATQAMELLTELFGTPDGLGCSMAVRATEALEDPEEIAASCTALAGDVREAWERLSRS